MGADHTSDPKRAGARGRRRWLALPLALAAATTPLVVRLFRGAGARTPTWYSSGGELGERVRAGGLPGVSHHRFRSRLLGTDVGLVVATPPGYDPRGSRRYASVYVFHGIGSDEWSYLLDVGLDSPMLKALFADPARAAIVVFGNPGDSGAHGPALRVLAEELVAFVDQAYLTRPEPAARSLDGFSLGGVTALTLALERPDVFGRAAAASSACYLIEACGALRAGLRERAGQPGGVPLLLSYGQKEAPENRAVTEEVASLRRLPITRLESIDHNWGDQLRAPVDGKPFGVSVAAFHLDGTRTP